MSKYNERHATTMLNALQGTDTLKQYAEQIRADERAKIVDMIDEISFGTLYCMADMCDRADKNCEKCALEYVIKRIKEQKI